MLNLRRIKNLLSGETSFLDGLWKIRLSAKRRGGDLLQTNCRGLYVFFGKGIEEVGVNSEFPLKSGRLMNKRFFCSPTEKYFLFKSFDGSRVPPYSVSTPKKLIHA